MRVLVIEDERKMADLIRKGLERDHHAVTTAHTGDEITPMTRSLEEQLGAA